MLRSLLLVLAISLLHAQKAPPPAITSPEVLRDGRVVFRLWAPDASDVQLSGDWMGPQPPAALTKSADGVWTVTIDPLPPNLYTYAFLVNGVRASDPACRCTLTAADRFASSWFTVPGSPPNPWESQSAPAGTLHHETYFSTRQGRARTYLVYTPPEYARAASKRFPALVLLPGTPGSGTDWTLGGGFAHVVFDNLIASGKMPPAVVIMHASDVLSNGRRLPNLQAFEPILIEELLPDVKRRYRLESDPAHWAIAGVSLGGEFAITVGLRHPEWFRSVASISGSMVERDFEDRFGPALADPQPVRKQYRQLWIGCGSEDVFAAGNAALAARFEAAGIPVVYHRLPGSHAMPVFRQQLVEWLSGVFRERSASP